MWQALPDVVQMPPAGCIAAGADAGAAPPGVINARALVGRTVAEVERGLILETLGHCLGNRTHAARILGISVRTLRNKLNSPGEAGP